MFVFLYLEKSEECISLTVYFQYNFYHLINHNKWCNIGSLGFVIFVIFSRNLEFNTKQYKREGKYDYSQHVRYHGEGHKCTSS